MSPLRLLCAVLGLIVGLLFYLGYRSDHTVSNRLLQHTCSPERYVQFKQQARRWLPVPALLRGSLPSALWCFIATSLAGCWRVRISSRIFSISLLCPLFNATWEVVQWLGLTNGRGDWLDAVAGVVGWVLAQLVFARSPEDPVEIVAPWDWRLAVATAGFACMGFAHVWK